MWFRSVALWTVTAATITAAVADEVLRRDFTLVQDALSDVNSLLQQIDTSILSLNQDNIKVAGPALLQLADTIRPSLMKAAAQIEPSKPLSLQETLGLNTARAALNQNVNLTVSDLIKQKPLFDAAGLSDEVADEVQMVRDMSGQLFGIIETKLDPGAPSETGQLTAVLVLFDYAVTMFRGSMGNATGNFDGFGSCVCVAICPAGSFSADFVAQPA